MGRHEAPVTGGHDETAGRAVTLENLFDQRLMIERVLELQGLQITDAGIDYGDGGVVSAAGQPVADLVYETADGDRWEVRLWKAQ